MRTTALTTVLIASVLTGNGALRAAEPQTPQIPAPPEVGMPLIDIMAAVAKKTGRKYLIDPRVHARIEIIGQDTSGITYPDLLSILRLQGFTAVDTGNYISIIPEAIVRQMPLPQVSGSQTYPDAQYVTEVIPIRNMPAALLVPILRPLLPQQSHLAAEVCSNALLMVDTFGNVKRIQALVAALDIGTPYKSERCHHPTNL